MVYDEEETGQQRDWSYKSALSRKWKLNYHGLLDKVRSITKVRQDNDMSYRIGAVYIENETKLSMLIWQDAVSEEKETVQQHDWSYMCGLCWKKN